MNHISFPGLGIKEFAVNPQAFELFGRPVMWYGVIISFGMILAVLYVLYRAKHNENIKQDDVFDYAIWAVLSGVIGARIYYVATKFEDYKADTPLETFKNCIAIWEGGIAIYGAIIGGLLAVIAVSYFKKIKLGKALDMISPAVMLAQSIGRWGNFFNAEAHGGPTTLPWRMGIRNDEFPSAVYVHPTFLYESLWNILGFVLINLFYKKKKYDGQIFVMYLTWYGFGRMLIEGLRTDSLYVGSFRISQVIGFLCFFIGACFLSAMEIVRHLRKKDEETAALEANDEEEKAEEEKAEVKEEEKAEEKKDDGVFEIADNYSGDEDDD
ncbi:MAG: prolipoprotein diacylglyceryl transferase [Clostridia bacterium]|nr:prolipoprotein diacylglyceryl transferase [Clostridia bacterium]